MLALPPLHLVLCLFVSYGTCNTLESRVQQRAIARWPTSRSDWVRIDCRQHAQPARNSTHFSCERKLITHQRKSDIKYPFASGRNEEHDKRYEWGLKTKKRSYRENARLHRSISLELLDGECCLGFFRTQHAIKYLGHQVKTIMNNGNFKTLGW